MIGKQAKPRGNAQQLAEYLMHEEKNEKVRVLEIVGCASRDVAGAMEEMTDIASLTNCKQYVFHMAFRTPEGETLTDDQKYYAIETYAKALGLVGHQRVAVVHENDGHEHVHVVWNRVNPDTAVSKTMSFSKLHILAASRILEYDLGHEFVQSREFSHNGVVGILKDLGRQDVASWVDQQRDPEKLIAKTPGVDHEEQGRRMKVDLEEVSLDVNLAWSQADSGKAFVHAIEEAGYVVAKGERRDFVLVDELGGVHSPARVIDGAKAKTIRDKFADIDKASLPTIEQAQDQQSRREAEKPEQVREIDDPRDSARRKALERTQELRGERGEKHIAQEYQEKEQKTLQSVPQPEKEAEPGFLRKAFEKIAKAVHRGFKTHAERQEEKRKKHEELKAMKKKEVAEEKQKALEALHAHEQVQRQKEAQKLEAELKSKSVSPYAQYGMPATFEEFRRQQDGPERTRPIDKDRDREPER